MNKWIRLLTNIHIHPLFWMVALVAILTARFKELLIVFAIVFIHELGHAMASSFFSWRLKRIMLLPFGGVAEVDEHGNRPLKEEFIVVIAGPLQHLWIPIFAYILYYYGLISEPVYQYCIEYNWMILLFNCLPILPLDGGKLVYLFFANYCPFIKALKLAIITSFIFLLLYCCMIVILFPFHLNGWFMALFLMITLYKEWKNRPYIFMRFLLDRYAGKMQKNKQRKLLYVSPEDTVQSVIERLYRGKCHPIVILENGRELKRLSESILLKAFFEENAASQPVNYLLSRT
ncbi:M50 family metallopeptidase [Caldibacillus lycopersici]|uniref:M50 family metallopeptidase n=1 Tax=Perspicuibacillus lycopersici TaxID=1325689 RepID=A0AAE3LMW8_9BACI|nr:M50 family metallopeptidase [Perspicuibacillus lycopersici]MCU9614005.1 M50 family metallopeptidase [Perspicuibacillus lycopersici]